ncbi:MAG: ornithine carbamoyltransferase, partial [Chloroflexi bacterium]|nr:ornithine carbamoyltransferase [Chloroflexota bacterium]
NGGGRQTVTQDIEAGLHNADVIYTDTWPVTANPVEQRRIAERFAPYQITAARLAQAKPDAMFLPCPPVHRGEEVSDDAMTSPLCRVYEAKEHLLHAQNALLVALFNELL